MLYARDCPDVRRHLLLESAGHLVVTVIPACASVRRTVAVTGGLTCHADAPPEVSCAGTTCWLPGSLASMAGRLFVKCVLFCSRNDQPTPAVLRSSTCVLKMRERALRLPTEGRRSPVWVCVPHGVAARRL